MDEPSSSLRYVLSTQWRNKSLRTTAQVLRLRRQNRSRMAGRRVIAHRYAIWSFDESSLSHNFAILIPTAQKYFHSNYFQGVQYPLCYLPVPRRDDGRRRQIRQHGADLLKKKKREQKKHTHTKREKDSQVRSDTRCAQNSIFKSDYKYWERFSSVLLSGYTVGRDTYSAAHHTELS